MVYLLEEMQIIIRSIWRLKAYPCKASLIKFHLMISYALRKSSFMRHLGDILVLHHLRRSCHVSTLWVNDMRYKAFHRCYYNFTVDEKAPKRLQHSNYWSDVLQKLACMYQVLPHYQWRIMIIFLDNFKYQYICDFTNSLNYIICNIILAINRQILLNK